MREKYCNNCERILSINHDLRATIEMLECSVKQWTNCADRRLAERDDLRILVDKLSLEIENRTDLDLIERHTRMVFERDAERAKNAKLIEALERIQRGTRPGVDMPCDLGPFEVNELATAALA